MFRATIGLSLLLCIFARESVRSQPQVIDTEVAIVGGGAAGTYAAVRLREDLQTSIVVIEPRDHLGGSVSTYLVPETNTTLEYGVQSYLRFGPALDFFARFGISTQPFANARRLTTVNVDVETGAELKEYASPDANSTNAAFQRFLAVVSQYRDFLEPGYWDFPLPQDIPADFLMTVGEFVKKYQIEAAIPRIVTISGLGYGGIGDLLAFDLMQAFGASLTKQVAGSQLVAPVGSNSLLYQLALALLGSDVLLSTTVQNVERTSNGVQLSVKQGSQEYLINAKRILYTGPPSLSALAPYDLDEKEKDIISKGNVEGAFIGVAKIPCIPENFSINFIPSAAAPSNQVALRDYPWYLRLDSTGPLGSNLFRTLFGANYTLPVEDFQQLVAESVQGLYEQGTISQSCIVDFKGISDHTRPQWYLSAEELKAGFFQDLYSLQGYKSTWYSGYAWAAPYSSTIWAFTDTVLTKLLEDLNK